MAEEGATATVDRLRRALGDHDRAGGAVMGGGGATQQADLATQTHAADRVLCGPLLPCRLVGRGQLRRPKQPDRSMERGRSRIEPLLPGVLVEELHVFAGQADTDLHTATLPGVGSR